MTDRNDDGGTPSTLHSVGGPYAFVVAFGTVAVVLPLLYLHKPLHFDEAIYVAVGERVLDGGRLYRDAIDHKPPGIFAVAAAGTLFAEATRSLLVALPGLPDPPVLSVAVLRLWTYGVVALTGLGVAALGHRVDDAATGMVAGVAYLLAAYLPYFQGYYFMTEPWAILPTVVAANLLLRRQRWADAFAGTAMAVGVLFNQTVFLFGLAFVVHLALGFRDPDRRSAADLASAGHRLAVIGVGFLVPIGVVLAVFATRGTLGDLLYYTVVLPVTNYQTPVAVAGRFLAVLSLLPVLVLAGGVVAALGHDLVASGDANDDLLFIALWAVALSYTGVTSFDAQHQLLFVFPPFVLLATVGWQRLVAARPGRDGADRLGVSGLGLPSVAAVLLVGLILATAGFNGLLLGSVASGSHVDEQVDATRAVEPHVDGPVYTWPPNLHLVVFSEDLQYGSRFYMGVYGPTVDGVIADLESRAVPTLVVRANHVTPDGDIDADRPRWFVEDKRPLVAYMNREYEPVARTEVYVIFRRIEASDPAASAPTDTGAPRPSAVGGPR